MMDETLRRFREGLAAGRYSIRAVARASGINHMTLWNMSNPEWMASTKQRLEKLESALDDLEQEKV